jgi:hypothetical protein
MGTSAPQAHSAHRMFGALLVRRMPGASQPTLNLERAEQGLFLLWLAYMGMLVFAAWLLWQAGAWHRLVEADPTRLTIVIVLMFIGCSGWAGRRAWVLGRQRSALDMAKHNDASWSGEFLQGTAQPGADRASWLLVLGERAHGPHEMAWWLNGIQLKLGLLGKVIGFSILALNLGQMESFDPSQSAQLLKSLTGGLGIALLTTVTGLTGNILLGLQLMRLDRFADALVADTLALSLQDTDTGNGASDGHRPTGP